MGDKIYIYLGEVKNYDYTNDFDAIYGYFNDEMESMYKHDHLNPETNIYVFENDYNTQIAITKQLTKAKIFKAKDFYLFKGTNLLDSVEHNIKQNDYLYIINSYHQMNKNKKYKFNSNNKIKHTIDNTNFKKDFMEHRYIDYFQFTEKGDYDIVIKESNETTKKYKVKVN